MKIVLHRSRLFLNPSALQLRGPENKEPAMPDSDICCPRVWDIHPKSSLFRTIIPYDIVLEGRLFAIGRLSFRQTGAASGHLAMQNEL